MFTLVSIVHVFVCTMLVMIVLLQQGKGADAGATFGGGGGNTLFGATGADNFLTRLTTFVAFCFMLTSVYLAFGMKETSSSLLSGSTFENLPATQSAAPSTEETTPSEATTTPVANPSPDANIVREGEAAQSPVAEVSTEEAVVVAPPEAEAVSESNEVEAASEPAPAVP